MRLRRSAATPAAFGAAAEVPKNVVKPGTDVLTPSGAVRSGLLRTSNWGNRVPSGAKTRVTGPTPVKTSGTVGVALFTAAIEMALVFPP